MKITITKTQQTEIEELRAQLTVALEGEMSSDDELTRLNKQTGKIAA